MARLLHQNQKKYVAKENPSGISNVADLSRNNIQLLALFELADNITIPLPLSKESNKLKRFFQQLNKYITLLYLMSFPDTLKVN